MNLATALRELRAHYGDSQHAFAARMGLSRRAIANYEKNRIPTLSVLAKLAQVAQEANRRDLDSTFVEAMGSQIGMKDIFLFAADMGKEEAHRAFTRLSRRLAAGRGLDAGAGTSKHGAFLMLNVRGLNSTACAYAFWRVMNTYLYPTSDLDWNAQAEQLLIDFIKGVQKGLTAHHKRAAGRKK